MNKVTNTVKSTPVSDAVNSNSVGIGSVGVDSISIDSVGIVEPQTFHFDQALSLECGRTLPEFDLIVETYGRLNPQKSNAILICHALSGSHHAAGYHSADDKKPGWWDNFIGPNKAVDTNKFYVVCLNNIGSCYGSTGPTSNNPATGKPYAADFPMVTIKDWVKTQVMLADRLGIEVWHAIVGGSMGGMQALQWSVDYPNRLKRCVVIASTPKLSAQNIAFNEVARQSILSDPDFCEGQYLEHNTYPKRGLILARMVGHITYLTDEAMKHKFGRDLKSGKFMYGYDVEFQVESYLRYQGERFSQNFDANTYLLMTKALDYFDPTRGVAKDEASDNIAHNDKTNNSKTDSDKTAHSKAGDKNSTSNETIAEQQALQRALQNTQCKFLIVSFTTDWRFAPTRSQEIVNALVANGKPVSYINIDAPYGHDSFLFYIPRYHEAVTNFLNTQE